MGHLNQSQRFRGQFIYAVALAAGACGTLIYLITAGGLALPPPGVLAGFSLFVLFTLAMSFPSPGVGYTSLDRVAQLATILVFGPVPAAIINGLAYLAWPFLEIGDKDFSFARAVLRALHNFGMFVFVVLIGGAIYQAAGGPLPINGLSWNAIAALIPMALAMQLSNYAFMSVITRLEGKSYWRTMDRFTCMVELAGVPLGVFMAIVFNRLPLAEFMLFLLVLLMLIPLMRRFAVNRVDLAKRVERMTAIDRLAQAVNASIDVDELAELTFAQCRRLINFSAFFLVLYDEQRDELDFRLHHNEDGRQPRQRRPAGEGLIGWLIATNRPVLVEDWNEAAPELAARVITRGRHSAAWLGVPVTYRDRMLGAISIQNYVPNTFTQADLDLMITFAGQVGAALTNAKLFHELQEYKDELEDRVGARTDALVRQADELRRVSDSLREANRVKEGLLIELQRKTEELDRQNKEDSLTGLYNRRYMDVRLAQELERAQRFGRDISIAMADLDFFKNINDRWSHTVGDEVLRVTAQIFRRECRSIDIISRYGGEEFIFCFPETDIAGAMKVCEKIRTSMAEYDWDTVHPGLKVTISIGVAGGSLCYDQDVLQKYADQKLYEAKDTGRDRVCA